jgi:methionyl-tRNA synthetase
MIFEHPQEYTETHGLSSPPYEHFKGCPECGGAYAEAHQCDVCGGWIREDYIMVSGYRICQDCYKEVSLDE